MADSLVSTPAIQRWVIDLFTAAGSSALEATQTADHLVGANLAGHDSHGIGMVPRYVNSLLNNELQLNQRAQIVNDMGSIITVDGMRGMGQSVTHQAMEMAIARAKQHGVCVMGLRNSHHLGRVGHWAEQAIAEGLCSIHFTNAVSNWWVAPHGGAEARFVTNPFTVGIPRAGADPILLDFATSAIAHGKVRVAYNKKVHVPPGSLIDQQGRPTQDPAVLFEEKDGKIGALVTAAAHKGYALAMVCELLGAALTGGETTQPKNAVREWAVWNNMLAIVFDPHKLGTGARFESEARSFIDWVKSAKLAEGVDEIMMPGDPERRSRKLRAERFPIDAGTMAQLDESAAKIRAAFGKGPAAASALAA